MSLHEKTKLVHISDALLTNAEMRCLTHDDVFLHDDVINAYIYCISAQEHLQNRADGKVHIASTFVSSLFKKDKIDPATHRHIVKRVNTFLEHDMVFLPVNIRKCHWYLSVINAKKREIQVLDSLGVGMGRSDLTMTLQGLDKHLKIACDMPEFKRGDRWQDLDIMNWTVVDKFQKPIQTDSASYGLFMLNCMEYWTGDILSDNFTQKDMKEFRRKLAVILLETELNKLKGSPIYYRADNEENVSDNEENVSDSDVEFLEDRKRKRQDSHDGAEDKSPLRNHIMAADPQDLVDELCHHIMSINDATSLE
uniref:Ubiquitin-like protease family profile domain-containing protein n=2 Tax=Triticum urartu TaxID=4572 RepID=A0A8R7PJ34_TRIUA